MNTDDRYESLVDAERRAEPSRREADRGWSRLQAAVHGGTRPMRVVAAPLALGAALFSTKAAALIAAAGASAAVAAATWAYRADLGIAPAPPARQAPANPASQALPRAERPPIDVSANESSDEPDAPPAVGRRSPTASAAPTTDRGAGAASLDAELDLLGRATAELDANHPGAALSLLRQHAVEFPRSMLAMEQETLRILAECSLHPGPRSGALAAQFLKQHPKSVHRDRLRRACQPTTGSLAQPTPTAELATGTAPAPGTADFPTPPIATDEHASEPKPANFTAGAAPAGAQPRPTATFPAPEGN